MHSYDEMSTCRSETYTARQHVTSTSQSVPQFRDQTVHVVQQSHMRDMASCEYGQIAGGTCGCSTDNPANVKSVVIAKCTKATDICGHTFETLLYTRSQICYWHGQVCAMQITVKPSEAYPSRLYLKLELASRFKNPIMNWLFEYWTRSLDPRIRLTCSIFEKSIHCCN